MVRHAIFGDETKLLDLHPLFAVQNVCGLLAMMAPCMHASGSWQQHSAGADAAVALVHIVNPLHDSITPNANQLLSLVALSLRSPESQGSALHWGAEHAKGSADLTNNTRLAVFGTALQLVVEDFIGKKHKVQEHSMSWMLSYIFRDMLAVSPEHVGFCNMINKHDKQDFIHDASRCRLIVWEWCCNGLSAFIMCRAVPAGYLAQSHPDTGVCSDVWILASPGSSGLMLSVLRL
jgi:hypothetical protein